MNLGEQIFGTVYDVLLHVAHKLSPCAGLVHSHHEDILKEEFGSRCLGICRGLSSH